MPAGRQSRYLAATLLVGLIVPLAASADLDPAKQREEQKKIKARVEEAARRLGSTIDAMSYQRLSPTTERKMLEGVANDLRGLSEDQLKEILAKLEAAIAASDSDTATAAQKDAVAKQRQVVTQLRGMLFRLDIIKSLDEAAARLDRAADAQLGINAQTLTNSKLPRRPGRQIIDDAEELSIEQTDLKNEVASVFKQVNVLFNDPVISKSLSQEQKDRIAAAEVLPRGERLIEEFDLTVRTLRARSFEDAGERQRRHAKELKDLAAALRTPPSNRLDALKDAADKVARAIDAQQKVNNDSTEKPTPAEIEKARQAGHDPKVAKGNELANQQTKAEFATRDARKAAEIAAPEVADMLKPAENNQWKAEDALRQGKNEAAKEPQDKAINDLKAAKAELDRQIAAAELAKQDPLAAVKQAAERIEKLIQDQKDANAKTQKAETNPAKLPDAKVAQKDVSKATDEVRNAPLPPNEVAKNALDKAAEAMKGANDKLDQNTPAAAKPDQQQALKNLEEAKAALDAQAKAIEQRREDIAKLEELKNKLEELAKKEKDVAKAADKAANDPKKPDTGDIAKKQDDLKPPTKDVNEQLKDLAKQTEKTDPMAAENLNKAADKVNDANMKQDGAKNDLAMNMPMAGSEKAKDAANKLEDAAKDVQAQLDQKKGQEAKDQAALQPNKIDPMNAAQQVQKALDQTNMAQQKTMEANMANQQPMMGMMMNGMMPMAGMMNDKGMMPMAGMMNDKGMMPMGMMGMMQMGMMMEGQPNINELQKQIAKQAADQKLPDAAKAADVAAKALDMGDLPKAIENQQKALDELNKAAMQQQPMGMIGMQPMGMMGMMPMGMMGMQPMGMQPGDKMGMQPGMMPMGMQPGDKMGMGMMPMGMQPGDKMGMQPGDKMGMGMMPMGMQPGDKMGMMGMGMQPSDKMGMGMMGMMGMGMQPGMGMMGGMMGQTPGQLAKQQQQVLDATKSLQQAQQANNAAQAAIQQAQANAPMAVQNQLQQAQNNLQQAQNNLQQGQPGQAGMNQQQAAQALQQALDALNAAQQQGMMGMGMQGMGMMGMQGMGMGMGMGMMGMGMQPGMGMGMMGMGMGMQPGMGMGMGMGMQPGMMGMGMGMGNMTMNETMSEGDMNGTDKLKNTGSTGATATGDGTFIQLRKKDRDKVQSGGDTQFPAEFRELIKQYNVNIKNAKPTTTTPGGK